MKILIAGATGFIGKELLKQLDAKGHETIVLTRNRETARFHIPIHCEIHQWDPEKSPLSTSSLKDVDAVINLSGENIASSFWTDTQKRKLMGSRVMSVRRIVQAMGLWMQNLKYLFQHRQLVFMEIEKMKNSRKRVLQVRVFFLKFASLGKMKSLNPTTLA